MWFIGVSFVFVIFALKHRLWVLTEAVRTCTHNLCFVRRFYRVPTIYVMSKNKKKYHNFSYENYYFYSREKSMYIAWTCFRHVPDRPCSFIAIYKEIKSFSSLPTLNVFRKMYTCMMAEGFYYLYIENTGSDQPNQPSLFSYSLSAPMCPHMQKACFLKTRLKCHFILHKRISPVAREPSSGRVTMVD